MKAKTLWILCVGGLLLTASCRHHGRNRMVMNDGTNRVEVRYEGDIQFSDDEMTIARISPGGYLEYWHNEDHLLAGMNDKGALEIELYENGKAVDRESAEGKALVAKVIRGMIDLGFDIDGRMDRLYRKGGYPALIREVDSVNGDYVRGRYLDRILGGDSLPVGVVAQVITRVHDRIEGDYDKERLITKIDTVYLKDDTVSAEYLSVVKGMGGDYEKSRALQYYLRRGIPGKQYIPVLEATESIEGDYEQSNILRALLAGPLAEGQPFDSLMSVVGKMDGDYEKSNLLKQIAHKEIREAGSWAGLIRTTTTVDGEYERGNVLIEIGQRLPKTDSLRTQYMNAAKTVHSDDQYGKVVKAVNL